MRSLPRTISVCLAILAVALAVTVVLIFQANRDLVRASQSLRADLREADRLQHDLQDENSQLAQELAAARTKCQDLEAKLKEASEARPAVEAARKASGAPALPQAFRLNAFVGRDFVGGAWVVPAGTAVPSTRRPPTPEPFVLLDESAREALTTYRTNVVEREVLRPVAVRNNNYYWDSGYGWPRSYYWPIVIYPTRHTARPAPTAPAAPAAPTATPAPSAPVQVRGASSSPWSPVFQRSQPQRALPQSAQRLSGGPITSVAQQPQGVSVPQLTSTAPSIAARL